MRAYISDGLISEALVVMQAMRQNSCYELSLVHSLHTYYGVNKVEALHFAIQCQWIRVVEDKYCEFSPLGEKLIQHFNGVGVPLDDYQDILRNYIKVCKPIWARRIPYGRHEAYFVMTEEERMCFRNAGLMVTPVTHKVVEWWDGLAEIERQKIDHRKELVGRKGEELTIQYEKKRIKKDPIWASIDSNLAGYDILSQVSEIDDRQVLIEVKSTTQTIQEASFYISRNEWEFASEEFNQNKYYFYIWLLGDLPKVAIVSYSDMKNHIPIDNGMGKWIDVNIPFSSFLTRFQTVEL